MEPSSSAIVVRITSGSTTASRLGTPGTVQQWNAFPRSPDTEGVPRDFPTAPDGAGTTISLRIGS